MKSSVSESKPFQSRSKGEIPGRARRKKQLSRFKLKQAIPIDSGTERFTYLIQGIRFGSWKVRRLNRALDVLDVQKEENQIFKKLMAMKLKGNHRAYKEWAPPVKLLQQNMNRIIHPQIDGRSRYCKS